MNTSSTKRVPNSLITNTELKEKEKALLYYLLAQANINSTKALYKLCKTSYKEILRALDIVVDKNYKKKAKKLLNALESQAYIEYEESSTESNKLLIEVLVSQPRKNFTRLPYALVNNKNVPLTLVPCYMSILKHDYMKGCCNPSLETIAKYTGASVRSCHERIKDLEALNLLEVERTKGGTRVTNTFKTSNGDSYLYELIEVEPRFEYDEPKKLVPKNKKVNTHPSIKSMLQERALEENVF